MIARFAYLYEGMRLGGARSLSAAFWALVCAFRGEGRR